MPNYQVKIQKITESLITVFAEDRLEAIRVALEDLSSVEGREYLLCVTNDDSEIDTEDYEFV
jgi:hypothetical protein